MPTGGVTSAIASARYRAIIPAMNLAKYHHVNILTIEHNSEIDQAQLLKEVDVVIVSKSYFKVVESFAEYATGKGVPVIFDVCDDHFSSPEHRSHYMNMCRLSAATVASTKTICDVIEKNTGKLARLISDPYEMPKGTPHFKAKKNLSLLWYGHSSNIVSLAHFFPQLRLLEGEFQISLKVVTAIVPAIENELSMITAGQSKSMEVEVIPWSLDKMADHFAWADIVIIPTLDDQQRIVKSPNRLFEAMWSGCYVVAGVIPSYQDFSKWAWVNNDLISGIRQAMKNPKKINKKIAKAQKYIANNHSPEIIANHWQSLLENVIKNSVLTKGEIT